MSPDNTTQKLATPRRSVTPVELLSGLFRTPTRLRTPAMTLEFISRHRSKRTRSSTLSSPTSQPTPSLAPCTNPSLPAVVLQTYSTSTDSIILTSLPSMPFCCHEDLLTMSRVQLEGVVRALNARLPQRMWIGPDMEDNFWGSGAQNQCPGECREDKDEGEDALSRMSEAEMRRRIEELVGIRAIAGKNRVSKSGLGLHARTGGIPSAPKAVRTRGATWRPYDTVPWEDMDTVDEDWNITIEDAITGSSPLAGRTKSGARAGGREGSSRLAILQEENEGSESQEDGFDNSERRPSKRRCVSSRSVTQNSGGERQTIQEGNQSRLIEDMDISGAPMLAEDETATTVGTTVIRDNRATLSKGSVEESPQRRRSVRIKEISLKRASSVDRRRKTSLDEPNLKPSLLRSRASSRCSPRAEFASKAARDPSEPRGCTIRFPFTTTSTHQRSNSFAGSAPPIFRSHSQRLLDLRELAKTVCSLGRSQSEKYPRAVDLAFVTINRPRYRFSRRKSKGSKAEEEDDHSPPTSVPPARATAKVQQDITMSADYSNEKHKEEKENKEPRMLTKNSGTVELYTGTLSSAFHSFLTLRPRAPSTSTIASTRNLGNDGGPQAGTSTASATIGDAVVVDGPGEHVSEALGRMIMD